MGAGDASRSDVERCQAGLPIDSGCGPVRIDAAAKAWAFVLPKEISSRRLWLAAHASRRASASVRSRHRPAGTPFGPS